MNIPLIIPRATNKPRNVDVLLMAIFRKTEEKKEPSIFLSFQLIKRKQNFSLLHIVIKW